MISLFNALCFGLNHPINLSIFPTFFFGAGAPPGEPGDMLSRWGFDFFDGSVAAPFGISPPSQSFFRPVAECAGPGDSSLGSGPGVISGLTASPIFRRGPSFGLVLPLPPKVTKSLCVLLTAPVPLTILIGALFLFSSYFANPFVNASPCLRFEPMLVNKSTLHARLGLLGRELFLLTVVLPALLPDSLGGLLTLFSA